MGSSPTLGGCPNNLPAVQETWVQSLGREDPLEKEMAISFSISGNTSGVKYFLHSSILAWQIAWTGEPGTVHGVAKTWTQLSDLTLSPFVVTSVVFLRNLLTCALNIISSFLLYQDGILPFPLSVSSYSPLALFISWHYYIHIYMCVSIHPSIRLLFHWLLCPSIHLSVPLSQC